MNQSPEKAVYLVFVGPIDQQNAQRIGQSLNAALSDGNSQIHLMIQSAGGGVGEGVFLYEILRSLPVAVTTYNCGQVCSAAVLAFLGGQSRVCSTSGLFMIHPTHFSPQFAFSGTLMRLADTALLEDARIEEIYGRHITLSSEQKAVHAVSDLWLGADEAMKIGLATEVGGFSIPPGYRPYFI